MSRRFIRLMLAVQALGLFATAARATTLFTASGLMGANNFAYCILTNVGTTPEEVTNAVVGAYSGVDVTTSNSCFSTLDPGKSCWAFYSTGINTDAVYCRFVASTSKVRGSLDLMDPNGFKALASIPATK